MSTAIAEAPEKKKAVVIWYDRMQGFGFLKVEGYSQDLYLHAQDVRKSNYDPERLLKGNVVLCNVGEHRGKPCAIELEELPRN